MSLIVTTHLYSCVEIKREKQRKLLWFKRIFGIEVGIDYALKCNKIIENEKTIVCTKL